MSKIFFFPQSGSDDKRGLLKNNLSKGILTRKRQYYGKNKHFPLQNEINFDETFQYFNRVDFV